MTVDLAHPSTEPRAVRATAGSARPWWWFWLTTPGRILLVGALLAVLGVASAFATSTTIDARQQALRTVLDTTEPLSYAAGQLYTTLSVADAAAATAFIAGAEPRDVRQRYEQAITDAAVALTRASAGLTDAGMQETLGRINAELAVYTGLVETARTNNRAGNPVGSSYLSEASALMQQRILPDAQRLYEQTSARVDVETARSAGVPVLIIVVVATTMVAGAAAHRWLARRTRRRVNVGVVAAGLAIVVMTIWVGTALAISTTGSRTAKDTAARSLQTVTDLAITAQQARADETLSLVRRGDEDLRTQSYRQRIEAMRTSLREYLAAGDSVGTSGLDRADDLLTRWQAADARMAAYIDVGDYRSATQVALGRGEDDATPAFDRLDAVLTESIAESRRRLRDDIDSALQVLAGTNGGAVVLSLGAVSAVAAGLAPRLGEYR